MTVLGSNEYGWIISHELFIARNYEKTRDEDEINSYSMNPVLFSIKQPFKKLKHAKIKTCSQVAVVKKAFDKLLDLFKEKIFLLEKDVPSGHLAPKLLADKFYEDLVCHPSPKFIGGNNSDFAVISKVNDDSYLTPSNCTFLCHDIKEINVHLTGELFDVILLDPPWWNKFIRRKRKWNAKTGYSMLYDTDLINLPLKTLLQDDGLVAVWCTNAPSHITATVSQMFPAWGVEYISQWFWLKVTQFGEPICSFSEPPGKQPYERIIFGARKGYCRPFLSPEADKVILSVPSAIHSHKPPLCELLKSYLKHDPKCLELFARYLLPNWTSYGNEVLKLQHISLYHKLKDKIQ